MQGARRVPFIDFRRRFVFKPAEIQQHDPFAFKELYPGVVVPQSAACWAARENTNKETIRQAVPLHQIHQVVSRSDGPNLRECGCSEARPCALRSHRPTRCIAPGCRRRPAIESGHNQRKLMIGLVMVRSQFRNGLEEKFEPCLVAPTLHEREALRRTSLRAFLFPILACNHPLCSSVNSNGPVRAGCNFAEFPGLRPGLIEWPFQGRSINET